MGIESHPDVCGGSACIVNTRIPVWLLKIMQDQGMTESQILDNYPTLTAEDLVNAWTYIRNHPDEISREIREHEDA